MARALSRAAPWSAFPRRGAEPELRVLGEADTAPLLALAAVDPVANVFVSAHLLSVGSAAPTTSGAEIFGVFDRAGRLLSACWAGANIVPIGVPEVQAPLYARMLRSTGHRYASIFGPASAVLAIYAHLPGPRAREVRAEQPLLAVAGPPGLAPDPNVRVTQTVDFDAVAPACVAMFEEEVGYSPVSGGNENYYRRVRQLIEQRHSLASFDASGAVVFKAELGAVSAEVSQVQGVWVAPEHRGRGLSEGGMAAVVEHARTLAPVVSLYVNDFNLRARACYERVGFEQVGLFATVLF